GASKTNINIMSDSVSYFTREFYKGGDDLTDAISKKLSLEAKDAESLKRSAAAAGGGGGGGGGGFGGGSEPIVMIDSSDAEKLGSGGGSRGDTGKYSAGGGG